jgi:hypothetical protein
VTAEPGYARRGTPTARDKGRRSYCDGGGAFGKKLRVSAATECKHAAMLRGQKIVDQPRHSSLPFASEPRRSPNYLLVYQRNL